MPYIGRPLFALKEGQSLFDRISRHCFCRADHAWPDGEAAVKAVIEISRDRPAIFDSCRGGRAAKHEKCKEERNSHQAGTRRADADRHRNIGHPQYLRAESRRMPFRRPIRGLQFLTIHGKSLAAGRRTA
jgi:hypothetical protein